MEGEKQLVCHVTREKKGRGTLGDRMLYEEGEERGKGRESGGNFR